MLSYLVAFLLGIGVGWIIGDFKGYGRGFKEAARFGQSLGGLHS